MTTTADTTIGLRFAADLLRALPGLAPVAVAVSPKGAVSIQVVTTEAGSNASEHARGATVEMLAAVLGLTPAPKVIDDRPWYMAEGRVGDLAVDVYAPDVEVVRPEAVTA